MLISVFTPTHDFTFLPDAYRSLKQQTYKNFEWVLVINGPKQSEIQEQVEKQFTELNVRTLCCDLTAIGALKRLACDSARGEIFTELDHDDFLRHDCLEKLFEKHSEGFGFVSSDAVRFFPDHTSEVFSHHSNWRTYPFTYDGKTYTVNRHFPINARSLASIYSTPEHIKSWTRFAYHQAGGHDRAMEICDDHDIMCRTYLAKIKHYQFEEPLYFYRRHDKNSFVPRANEIANVQQQVMNKYLHRMVFEWCRREELGMIDLGGQFGSPREHGFETLDLPGSRATYECDVTKDLPFRENTIGCFRAVDFLEHIPANQVVGVMNRLYDKLAPGGWLITSTPSVSGPDGKVGLGAYQSPDHYSFWCQNSFWYYTNQRYRKYVTDIRCRFQSVRCWTDYPSLWHRENQIPYVHADLWALKGQRPIGQVEI